MTVHRLAGYVFATSTVLAEAFQFEMNAMPQTLVWKFFVALNWNRQLFNEKLWNCTISVIKCVPNISEYFNSIDAMPTKQPIANVWTINADTWPHLPHRIILKCEIKWENCIKSSRKRLTKLIPSFLRTKNALSSLRWRWMRWQMCWQNFKVTSVLHLFFKFDVNIRLR